MFKAMLLQTSLTAHIYFAIMFVTVPTISKRVCGTAYILLKTSLTCQKIYQAFVITIQALVNFIMVWVTALVGISFPDVLRHTWHPLPVHLQDSALLSIG